MQRWRVLFLEYFPGTIIEKNQYRKGYAIAIPLKWHRKPDYFEWRYNEKRRSALIWAKKCPPKRMLWGGWIW